MNTNEIVMKFNTNRSFVSKSADLFSNDQVLGDAYVIIRTFNNSVGFNTICVVVICVVFSDTHFGSWLKTTQHPQARFDQIWSS